MSDTPKDANETVPEEPSRSSTATDIPVDVDATTAEPAPGATAAPGGGAAPAEPALVLRKDPNRRDRRALALGSGLAFLAVFAALAPTALALALLWPLQTGAGAGPQLEPPRVDFDAIRKAALEIAPPPSPNAQAQPVKSDDGALKRFVLLTSRVYDTREVRRKAGVTGKDIFKVVTIDELGGDAFVKEMGLDGKKRYIIGRRDGKPLFPADADVPKELLVKDGSNDVGPFTHELVVGGKPTRLSRTCMWGETYCIIDVLDAPAPALAAAPAINTAPLDDAIKAQQATLSSWKMPAPQAPPAATRAPPALAAIIALGLAVFLGVVVLGRARQIAGFVVAAGARLRAIASGKAVGRPDGSLPHEIAELHKAIDEALAAIGDAENAQVAAERRRARIHRVESALTAAAHGQLDARVPAEVGDDANLTALVDAANRALEAYEARVLRWKSHVAVVDAQPTSSKLEERAEHVAKLPPLIADAAQRLLRVARVPGVPASVVDELNKLGNALAERARVGQALVDQLLLDAATDRPSNRVGPALTALKEELSAVSTSKTAPATVAALQDLPPEEIARRVTDAT